MARSNPIQGALTNRAASSGISPESELLFRSALRDRAELGREVTSCGLETRRPGHSLTIGADRTAIRQAGSTTGFRALEGAREVHAVSNKPKKNRTGRLAQPTFPVKFTGRDIDAVVSHVPVAKQKQLERLGDVLNDWAKHDMQRAFKIYPDKAVAQERLKIIRLVFKHAEGLSDALAKLEKFDGRSLLVWALTRQQTFSQYADFVENEALRMDRLADQQSLLREIKIAAQAIEKAFVASKDQRRNITAYLLLLDMAAIFEWLTGRPPTRGSKERPRPFNDVVSVLWCAIYGDHRGIEAALKNWARHSKKFRDKSPVISNVDYRHPDWRLLNKKSRKHSS